MDHNISDIDMPPLSTANLDDDIFYNHQQLRWVARVQQALESDHLTLDFQSIINPHSSSSCTDNNTYQSFELLLRLRDGRGDTVLPGNFLPALERYRLAAQLDRWVIAIALQWLNLHREQLDRIGLCTVNLSSASLEDPALEEFLLRRFANDRALAKKLCFDIRESTAIEKPDSVAHFIRTFRDQGCQFALENFGLGWASFEHLRDLPVALVKINGSLIDGMLSDAVDHSIVKSIVDIGHAMGKQVVATHVETEDALTQLRELGIDFVQGYYLAQPQRLSSLQLS